MPTPHGFPTREETQAAEDMLDNMVKQFSADWMFAALECAFRRNAKTFSDRAPQAFWNDVANLSHEAHAAMTELYNKHGM